MKSSIKRQQLNRRESRVLEDWIVANWEWIEADKPTMPDIAEKINKLRIEGLEKRLTENNIKGAVVALGKDWPNSIARGGWSMYRLRLDELTEAVRVMESRLTHLEQALGEADHAARA